MTKNVPIHLILTKKLRALEEKQLAAGRKLTSSGKIIITYTSALSSLIRINIVSWIIEYDFRNMTSHCNCYLIIVEELRWFRTLTSRTFAFLPIRNYAKLKWRTFCRRADEKFKKLADPRIFLQHLSREYLKRRLSRKKVVLWGVPRILGPKRQSAAKSDPRKERKTSGIVKHNIWQVIQRSYRRKSKWQTCRKVISVKCIHQQQPGLQQRTPVWSATTITRTYLKTRTSNTDTFYARRNLQWKGSQSGKGDESAQPPAKKLKLALILKDEEGKWFKTCWKAMSL